MFADNQPTGQVDTGSGSRRDPPLCSGWAPSPSWRMPSTLLSKLGGDLRISTLQRGGQTLYRVRSGPLAFGRGRRRRAFPHHRRGRNDAHIVVDQ